MRLSKGQYLYKKGDFSDAMYVVRSGRIGLYSDGNDETTELARIESGELIGDLAYFSKAARTSDAKALTEVEVIRIPFETIQTQFESVPTWIQTMTKKLAEQVQTYSREIKSLKDEEQGKIISRLAVARTWSTLTFVSMQLGVRDGDTVTVDWPTLRTYANLALDRCLSTFYG